MVVRHIPTLMAIGAVLAAYRLLGVGDVFKELIKKDLQPAYDYVIGIIRYTCDWSQVSLSCRVTVDCIRDPHLLHTVHFIVFIVCVCVCVCVANGTLHPHHTDGHTTTRRHVPRSIALHDKNTPNSNSADIYSPVSPK